MAVKVILPNTTYVMKERCLAWREFSRKFTSPINYYGWHVFEKQRRLLAESWRRWTCEQQAAPN